MTGRARYIIPELSDAAKRQLRNAVLRKGKGENRHALAFYLTTQTPSSQLRSLRILDGYRLTSLGEEIREILLREAKEPEQPYATTYSQYARARRKQLTG